MSKRKAEEAAAGSSQESKRNKQSTLGSWITMPAHLKLPIIISPSPELQDRDSTFIAHAASVTSQAQVDIFRRHIREAHVNDEASHEMLAARLMDLVPGKTGLNETDFTLKVIKDDDGEKYGSDAILRVLEKQGQVDKAVVVSRWFGGTLLGRVRFDHIEQVTKDALLALQKAEDLFEALEQLQTLDDQISQVSKRLLMSPAKPQSYDNIDSVTAKRLVTARTKRLEALKRKVADAGTSVQVHEHSDKTETAEEVM